MDNKFKKPKSSDTKILSSDVETLLIGLMILLISIIGLLNKGPVGNFLTYVGIYLFGAFYFVAFLILIFFAIYLMIKKKTYKLRVNMRFFGVILVYLSCIIASSTSNSEIRFNNLFEVFNDHMAAVSSSIFVIDSISNLPAVGGGFLGYLLKALLNTCITEVGTKVVVIIFMFIGLTLLLKDAIVYIVKFFFGLFKNHKKNKENVVKDEKEEKNDNVNETDNKVPFIETKPHEVFVTPTPISSTNFEREEDIQDNSSNDSLVNSSYFDEVNDDLEDIEPKSSYEASTSVEELDVPKRETVIKDYFADSIDDMNNDISTSDTSSQTLNSYNSFEQNKTEEIKEERNQIFNENVSVASFNVKNEEKSYEKPVETYVKEEKREYKVETPIHEEVNASNHVEPQIQQNNVEKVHTAPKKKYVLPSGDLLEYHAHEDTRALNESEAAIKVEKINRTFAQYKIGAQVISYTIGPSVTRFNVKMNEGVRVNTLSSVTNEISIALNGDKSVRLELIVEGRDTSSIEVGNKKATPVSFKECFDAVKDKTSEKDKLIIPLGKDIENQVVTTYMNELPHLLVAGTTGSGKSVFVNTIIATFIMRNTPDELKLVLVDPKKVEFTPYANIPHLLCPIITEASEAAAFLKKLCDEMDDRYNQMALRSVSKISDYNALAEKKGFPKIPSIVLVIDEYADLITKNAKEIEGNVQRICQKARAAGIYLILCTQRPSVNVVTGDIKAVIPSRIGLLVPQANDSKVILDATGAESLLGNGDMLCQIPRRNGLVRVQGAYISGLEIASICDFIKSQREVEYDPKFCNLVQKAQASVQFGEREIELDELYEEAKQHVIETRIASTSNLQSYFQIGFPRADSILVQLERNNIVKRVSGNRRIVIAQANGENKNENEE